MHCDEPVMQFVWENVKKQMPAQGNLKIGCMRNGDDEGKGACTGQSFTMPVQGKLICGENIWCLRKASVHMSM